MKRMRKILSLLWVFVFVLAGCADETPAKYIIPSDLSVANAGTVDKNDRFELQWDSEYNCLMLKDIQTGYVWGTAPYDVYKTGETEYSLSSMLSIDYFDSADNSLQTEKSYTCIEEGTVNSEIKDNAINLTYYFSAAEITVPLRVSLRDGSVLFEICSDKIVESGKTDLINVSVAPYFCALKNSDSRNQYVFVPSGSGALMYTDDRTQNSMRDYSGEVYGNDIARTKLDNPGDEEAIRLPCFGIANGENALFGIVENEEGSAFIHAATGDADLGYSNAYVSFNVRGYNNIEWSGSAFHGQERANDTIMLQENISKGRTFSVGFYPLSGKDANYSGMADCYREYLIKNKMLQKSESEQKAYRVNIIGGALQKKFFCGIPYHTTVKITDFDESKEICEAFLNNTKKAPAVVLLGFGESGYDVGKIAGGFDFAGVLGSNKSQSALESYCKTKNIPLFSDFDIIRFNDSADGFNTFFDSAQTANTETVSYYAKNKNIRSDNRDSASVKFLKRSQITSAMDKLLDFCDKKVSGISLSSFGSMAYSDYSSDEYTVKGKWNETAKKIASAAEKSGHTLFGSSANAYYAGLCDAIGDVPLQSGNYNGIDVTVPFYEMVYAGYVPLYTSPINLSLNSQETMLYAVETGVSPSFTVGKNIFRSLIENNDSFYYGIDYAENFKSMVNSIGQVSDYFDKVAGQSIVKHEILSKNVAKTVFQNGTKVIVNHSEMQETVEGVTVKAKGFEVIGGEKGEN